MPVYRAYWGEPETYKALHGNSLSPETHALVAKPGPYRYKYVPLVTYQTFSATMRQNWKLQDCAYFKLAILQKIMHTGHTLTLHSIHLTSMDSARMHGLVWSRALTTIPKPPSYISLRHACMVVWYHPKFGCHNSAQHNYCYKKVSAVGGYTGIPVLLDLLTIVESCHQAQIRSSSQS